MKRWTSLVFVSLASLSVYAQNINEAQFNQRIDEVLQEFAPTVKAHGAELIIFGDWTNPTVNAWASQNKDSWNIMVYGGLARHAELDADSFQLVVCHELGHHLSGFVFLKNSHWAASEGQADYFATHVCTRKLWRNQKNRNAESAGNVDPIAKIQCDQAWQTNDDRNLCYRTANASQKMANFLRVLRRSLPVQFSTPDPTVVQKTNPTHLLNIQCRLDTYLQGALCTNDFDLSVIPGKNHPDGNNSLAAEKISAQQTCTRDTKKIGVRPACWFKSRLGN